MKINPTLILSTPLGLFFLVSGWLKAIDPFGGALKIEEYLAALGLAAFDSYAMVFSILLCAFEISLGLFLLFGVFRRLTAIAATCMMLAFTALTAYLAFDPYVAIQECGCFGEAIDLTNMETFIKNVIILLAVISYSVILFFQPKNSSASIAAISILIFAILVPIYSFLFLPPFDFLGFNRGVDLSSNQELHIYDNKYEDVTESLLQESNQVPQLWIVAQHNISKVELETIKSIIEHHQDKYRYMVLSSENKQTISNIPQYFVDKVALKELLRAKSGIVLIDRGVIRGKWNLANLKYDQIKWQDHVRFRYWLFVAFGFLVIYLTRFKLSPFIKRIRNNYTIK
ncbi:MAG: DoxX family protein [Rikenellaceae bacterium]